MMNQAFGFAVLVGILTGIVVGQPIEKSGNCPTLERETPTDVKWGSIFSIKPNPASEFPSGTIQKSIAAEKSINCIKTQEGLKVQLWASEKSQGNPLYLQHFTFDERGRLWAVEPKSYPNIIRTASGTTSDQKFVGGLDRIVIMEDTDGDHVMDKMKVFVSGLNLPQAIEVVNGGIVVAMAPYVVFYPNVNDSAGPAQILFSGMGVNGNYDTHGGINSLMYGLDNWIYGHTGYNSCKTNNIDCGGGKMWRFQHTALGHAKTVFQVWSAGPANAHGIGQMEDGQLFQTGATGTPHILHAAVQGAATQALDIRTSNAGSPKGAVYPITGDRYLWEGSTGKNDQGWYVSTPSTAISGMEFYTARLFPQKYWDRMGFVCEGASKLCNMDSMVVTTKSNTTGSTWQAVRLPGPDRSNIFASTDAWVAPLQTKTGPDGALWVLDWNNYLFLHNPAGPSGAGNAWINELRVKTTNRIYRIVPTDGKVDPVINLTNATEDVLVNTLSSSNMFWRLTAQRLLLAKGYTTSLGTKLQDILDKDKSVDVLGNNPRVVHVIWTLHGLGQFDTDAARWNPILAKLLQHPAWGVRRNALKAMPRTTVSAQAISDKCSVNDLHGHVRLQALVALGEISSKPAELKTIWNTFANIDGTATAATTASGLTAAATQPCSPVLDSITSLSIKYIPEARVGLKFTQRAGNFILHPNGNLVSGKLTLFDLRGHAVFSSEYESVGAHWSRQEANGLKEPVYGYEFRGVDGSNMHGKISNFSNF
ncbi:MAG: PVC-type heme-binding CxxCH protein [Fibrobacteria bacterium]